jgi:hypothetical protein
MRRSPSKSWRHQKELLVLRRSSFAKFSGVTISKKKQLGNEKMNSEKTTHTYLLANPNLEGEIHLKGVRLVTSQNLKGFKKNCTHEIIPSFHACIHSFKTLHRRFLSQSCCSFDQKPSLYVNNREEIFTTYKIVLNQIRVYLQSFQTKIKRK